MIKGKLNCQYFQIILFKMLIYFSHRYFPQYAKLIKIIMKKKKKSLDTNSSQTVNKWTSYKTMYAFYYEYNHLSVLYDSTSRMLYTVIKETWSGPEVISGLRAPPLVVSCSECSDFKGFCSNLLMICVTVSVWHNNTQQHAQVHILSI